MLARILRLCLQNLVAFEKVIELCKLLEKRNLHDTGGPVSLFRNDELGTAGIFLIRLINFFGK